MDDYRPEYWFDLDGKEETEEKMKQYFEENGFVVALNVIKPEQILRSLEEISDLVGVQFGNLETYDKFTGNRYGVIGKEPITTPQMNENRLSPSVRQAYQILYGKDREIAPCLDRVAWMRPTAAHPQWTIPYTPPGVHLDVSPYAYFQEKGDVDRFLGELRYGEIGDFVRENNAKHKEMGKTIQGVLNLVDNQEQDGGFHCVPGGHKEVAGEWFWGEGGRGGAKERLKKGEPCGRYIFENRFREDMKLCGYTERVVSPAGALLLFDCLLPHGTRPNQSGNDRIIQFLRYLPTETLPLKARKNREAALKKLMKH